MSIVQDTWNEIGKKITPTRNLVFVRTALIPEKIGSIYLPPKKSEFYGRLKGNETNLTATVLAFGKDCLEEFSEGMQIAFKRLFFASCQKMKDNTVCGWISEEYIDFVVEESTALTQE